MTERYDSTTTEKSRLPSLSIPQSAAYLVVTQGEGVGRQVPMKETPLVIGRSSDCDMRLLNRAVSRLHCRVWKDSGGFWLRDLNSTNKTYLNDRPVVEARLKDGDLVMVGGTVMQFYEKQLDSIEVSSPSNVTTGSSDQGGMDILTGLPTRKPFDDELDREIARCRRHGRTFVLAVIDVDGLDAINQTHGKPAGDDVMRQIARMLRAGLRAEDVAARVGGDELGVLLTEVHRDVAMPILQSIRSAIGNSEFVSKGQTFKITVSVGAAMWEPKISSRHELVVNALAELRKVRDAGRNQVMCA
jgi:diguanylate cyclase (GGDEF)-like protein